MTGGWATNELPGPTRGAGRRQRKDTVPCSPQTLNATQENRALLGEEGGGVGEPQGACPEDKRKEDEDKRKTSGRRMKRQEAGCSHQRCVPVDKSLSEPPPLTTRGPGLSPGPRPPQCLGARGTFPSGRHETEEKLNVNSVRESPPLNSHGQGGPTPVSGAG